MTLAAVAVAAVVVAAVAVGRGGGVWEMGASQVSAKGDVQFRF